MSQADAETDTRAARSRRLLGIALMCGAVVSFASLDACGKTLARLGVDPLVATFMRYAVNVALITLVLNPVRRPEVVRSRRLGLQVVRSLLLFGTTALNFLALRYLQMAETVSIQFAAPLAVALLAGPLLGERSSRERLAAIAVGFLGVLVIVRPGVGDVHPAVLLSLGNMACYAFYVILTRKLAAYDSTATTMFYSGLAGLAVMAPAMPWLWTTPQSWQVWALLIGIGLLGTFGHWLLILAHARAPASVLAPFIYTQLIWSVTLGFLVFGDVPSGWTLAGALVVIGSGLYLLAQEARRRPRAGPA
ncbi:DMT family transporter [Methylobacterium dankookense]|uniref:Riboflavin transporter n=1 Tax=Methylobacterium dankookense TaxID=560405 RepID=A0A564FS76_9HYPH|nr:DMT family transporter [Methylobacterium dankookense]GJD57178.1 Riboflavin transporter [Methylobacterium dankookense]VUF10797.1 Riboflavin transporter [Methylobacterium dankookense]